MFDAVENRGVAGGEMYAELKRRSKAVRKGRFEAKATGQKFQQLYLQHLHQEPRPAV
jgi:hypothetical protein